MRSNIKQEIFDYINKEIIAGCPASGYKLPTEPELAKKFNTSITSAHRAVKELEAAGIVERIKGKGTFIVENPDFTAVDRLKHEQEKKIHIILPADNSLQVHWQTATLQALEAALRDGGYRIIYFEYDDVKGDPGEFENIIREIAASGSNGIVVSSMQNIYELLGQNRNVLVQKQIPLYFHNITGEYIPDIICSMISQDPYSDGVLIGELVARKAYRDVKFIGSHEYPDERYYVPGAWLQTRIRGISFGLALEKNGSRFSIVNDAVDYDDIYGQIKKSPGQICIVGVNAKVAADFINGAEKKGLKAPDDYELISFDDNPRFLKYNITALSAPFSRIGNMLGQMICDRNPSGQGSFNIWIKVPYELKERMTFKVKN